MATSSKLAHDLMADQVSLVIRHLSDVRADIAAMAVAEHDGRKLWFGGLPGTLTQLDLVAQHHINGLRQDFGLPPENG